MFLATEIPVVLFVLLPAASVQVTVIIYTLAIPFRSLSAFNRIEWLSNTSQSRVVESESLLETEIEQEDSFELSEVIYRTETSRIRPFAGQSLLAESTIGDKVGGSLSVIVTVKEQRWPDADVTITLVDPI